MIGIIFCIVVLTSIEQCLCTGQITPVDVTKLRSDPYIQRAFEVAVHEFNRQSNSLNSFAPYQVHSIQHQVVAGIYYRFDVTLMGTNCLNKQEDKNNFILIKCKVNEQTSPVRAQLHVVHQAWMKPEYQFNVASISTNDDIKLHDQLFVIGIPDGELSSGANFDLFKQQYGKIYDTEEEEIKRFKIFHQNFKKAMIMKIFDKGSAEYGITQFSDFSEEEFAQQQLGPVWDQSKKPSKTAYLPMDYAPPKSVNWTAKGAVSEVKNQGSCGSCWAFSTTGNIEGQWFVKKNQLISLSEQQLVDCDTIDSACNGGLPSQAYKAIIGMGGLESEASYPYAGRKEACQMKKNLFQVYINDSMSIDTSEVAMAAWCALNGPISIGINAFAMQFYRGGISYPYSFLCNKDHLDHGVLIVGYDVTASGEPFWIVKNSWGPTWGEKGYYLVYRGAGVCGLNKMPTSAIVK